MFQRKGKNYSALAHMDARHVRPPGTDICNVTPSGKVEQSIDILCRSLSKSKVPRI